MTQETQNLLSRPRAPGDMDLLGAVIDCMRISKWSGLTQFENDPEVQDSLTKNPLYQRMVIGKKIRFFIMNERAQHASQSIARYALESQYTDDNAYVQQFRQFVIPVLVG